MSNGPNIKNMSGLASAMSRLANRVYGQQPTRQIAGIDPNNWPSAQQPIAPVGPAGSQALSFPYLFGQNLNFTPRVDSLYDAATLRMLSCYPLARILIENTKDQLCKIPWSIELRQMPGESQAEVNARRKKDSKGDENIKRLSRFFEYPNRELSWQEWIRPFLDDMLVIDAASFMVLRDSRGGIGELRWTDGSCITRLIDERGFTPAPPSPAYQQVYQGMPRIDLTTDELIYRPRNIVPRQSIASYLYGFSPTEQLADEIKVGMGRLAYVLAFYERGSLGNVIHVVPPRINPDKIREAMNLINSILSGNVDQKRMWTMIQGFREDGKDDQIIMPKEPVMADVFDDVHVRKLAFGFGASPQRLQKPMNRGCHSEDTETLTDSGWKLYQDITTKDKIATVNPTTGKLEYQFPDEKMVYPYSGDMLRFKTKNVDVLVTPEHRMWHRPGASDSYTFTRASDMRSGHRTKFLASTVFEGNEVDTFNLPAGCREYSKLKRKTNGNEIPSIQIPMDDWLEFLGYYLSEGGLSSSPKHYLLTLCQSQKANPNIVRRIQDCLTRVPFKSKRYPEQADGMARWSVYGKSLHSYLSKECGSYCWDKRIPRQFMSLSARQLDILLTALMDGDGSYDVRMGRNNSTYTTASQQLASDVQELALKLGYCASIRTVQKEGNRRLQYVVHMCRRAEHSYYADIKSEPYTGMVYCFRVKNGTFITRRNGKVSIHGNSAQASQQAAVEEGIEPFMFWMQSVINFIIQVKMELPEYSMEFDLYGDPDLTKQSKADEIDVKNGIRTRNQIREERGLDPDSNPWADKLTVTLPNGVVELGDQAAILGMAGGGDPVKPKPAASNKPNGKAAYTEVTREGVA